MKTLIEIGNAQMCDKGDAQHSHAGESYFDVYERWFNPLRDKHINFLELGVRDGKSLRVWREYFEHANILGVDINPQSAHQDTKGCKVEICSQTDREKLTKISKRVKGWDIVVDDASHLNKLTAQSFEILWPTVRPGGLYIIEDLKVSYMNLEHTPEEWNFIHLNPDHPSRINIREDLDKIFREKIKDIDFAKGDVRSVSFYQQMVILEKIR